MATIKGLEFPDIKITDSYERRSKQLKNKIIDKMKILGLTEDDMEIPLERLAIKKAQAQVSWYLWEEHMFISYKGASKFVENLAMVYQVIEHFIDELIEKKISPEEFIELFREDEDIMKKRKEARELLGVEEGSDDFEAMHSNYRKMSKELHPDMPGGDAEKFKQVSVAHKIVRKEFCP